MVAYSWRDTSSRGGKARLHLSLAFLLLLVICLAPACGRDEGPVTQPPPTGAVPQPTVTAAPDAYSFAVCGDNRTTGIESGVMGRIIESAKARGASFIVNTGDVTDGGDRDELLEYKAYTDASGIMFYTVPGNHDVGKGGVSRAYEEIIGPYYYSFDYGPDHFVVLDNADDEVGIDDVQMNWFTQDLDANRGMVHTFVFTHIPIADSDIPSGHVSGEKGAAGLESGKRVVEEAGKRPNVSDFFFGHIHAYFAYSLNGFDAYITGGAGAPLYFPEGAGGYYNYLLVTVRGQDVSVEVVRV